MRSYLIIISAVLLLGCQGGGASSEDGSVSPQHDANTIPDFPGTAYFIDPSGDDDQGDGSQAAPWRTLARACAGVTTAGDGIWVNAGDYYETETCDLAEGVSITGTGPSSRIVFQDSTEWAWFLRLHSDAEGTDGNQSISFVQLDGDGATAWIAVQINARSNVRIHHCTIVNFRHSGVTFNGVAEDRGYDPPAIHATGNEFSHNTVSNCSEYDNGYGSGNLQIGGQEGMRIFGNTIVQDQRADEENGYCIKYYSDGFNRGVQIYDNVLVREAPTTNSARWNFAIELWSSQGGIEIFDNTIFGSVDTVRSARGDYDFALDIHHNVIGYEELQLNSVSANNGGVFIERDADGVYVRQNTFRNVGTPIQIYPSESDLVRDIVVQYNLFDGVGIVSGGESSTLVNWASVDGQTNVTIEGFHFVNNTVAVGEGGAGMGLRLPSMGQASQVTVQNNIFQGFQSYPVLSNLENGATLNGLLIENNLFHANAYNEVFHGGAAPTDDTTRDNLVADPLFHSTDDFRLMPGSPAIGAGLPISGVTGDRDDVAVGNPPNIGCYETIAN